MSCCGQKRLLLRTTFPAQAGGAATPRNPPPQEPPARGTLLFTYSGRTGLTVIGPITGQRYRFDKPGAVAAVDASDAPLLVVVPNLRALPG